MLAHLRNGDTYQRLATGFGIGLATAYRYIRETTDLLAARALSLTQAVTRLAGSFSNYALLDGTVISIDRTGDRDRLKARYSVKVRHYGILDTCRDAGPQLVADRGYIGAGEGVHLPYRRYNRFTPGRRAANRAHSAIRCLVERGIATLKNWRVLTPVRASPHRVTTYARPSSPSNNAPDHEVGKGSVPGMGWRPDSDAKASR